MLQRNVGSSLLFWFAYSPIHRKLIFIDNIGDGISNVLNQKKLNACQCISLCSKVRVFASSPDIFDVRDLPDRNGYTIILFLSLFLLFLRFLSFQIAQLLRPSNWNAKFLYFCCTTLAEFSTVENFSVYFSGLGIRARIQSFQGTVIKAIYSPQDDI